MFEQVLRPRATVAAETGAGGEPAQPHSLPMDAADANAIAEVSELKPPVIDQAGICSYFLVENWEGVGEYK